jgi:Icc protein
VYSINEHAMKIIHISDLHLTIPGERMAGLNPHKRFESALADVNENHADAQRIIITGDLTHWGEMPAYESLREIIAKQTISIRLMIGNHDDRSVFLEAFPDHPRDDQGYINYAESLDGTRLIYLDTTAPKTHAGHFGADRQLWLETELRNNSHVRIFLHHNPMELGLPAVDLISLVLEDRPSFKALLEKYSGCIDYIHFGHVHAPIHGTFCGIPFASVPSTVNQSIPSLTETELLLSAPLDPKYYVIQVCDNETIIHQIPFTWDGPVFTSGTGWEDWTKQGI